MNDTTQLLANSLVWPTASRRFLKANRQTIRTKGSRDTYEKVLRHLQGRHPDKRVVQFTKDDVFGFCTEDGLTSSTLTQRRNVLIAFFEWAAYADKHPLANADLAVRLRAMPRIPHRPKRLGNWLTAEKLGHVLAACDDGTDFGIRDKIIIVLGCCTGLRRMELAGLRWGDVDLAGSVISVLGKGEKPAQVGISPQLREVLFEWRSKCVAGLGRPVHSTDPVLPRLRCVSNLPGSGHLAHVIRWHEPVGVNAIWRAVRTRGEMAGIGGLAPHDLRRTFAGLLEEQADLLSVSKALRHSNVGTTQTYLEQNPKRGVQAGQAFTLPVAL